MEHQPKEQPTILTRRNTQASIEEEYHHPNKKQKTITFNDEDVQDSDECQENRDKTQELSNRRGILKFNVKSSNKN